MSPVLSIVTINLNNAFGLEKTIDSVVSNKDPRVQYVVVDGLSSDASGDVIYRNEKWIDKYIIEKDNGVFDAFNKGLKLSDGNWICMMNSGDVFNYSSDLIDEIESVNTNFSVILTRWQHNGEIRNPGNISELESGKFPFCHQAMFIRRGHFYNSNLRIFGDMELLARIYKAKSSCFYYSQHVVADYEGGGISSQASLRKRFERVLIVYFYFGFQGVVKLVKGALNVSSR